MKLQIILISIFALLVTACTPSVRHVNHDADHPPDDPLLYNIMVAEIAGHSGLLEDSVRHYREVVEESEQIVVIRRAVRIMLFAKDYEAADKAITKWLTLAPENMEAHQLAITVNLNQGDISSAIEHLEWVNQYSGKLGLKVVASILERMENTDAALSAMEAMVSKHMHDAEAHVVYARMAYNAGQYDKSRQSANRALEIQQDNNEAHIILARSRIELGEVEQALDALGEVVEQSPDNQELRLNYARLLVTSNRFESAIHHFNILIKQKPEDPDLLYSSALIMMQIKNYSGAEQYFRELLSLDARVHEATYYLGRLEEDRKQYEAALDWYQEVEEGTLYLESQIGAARAMAKLGDVENARDAFESLRTSHADLAASIWLSESDMLRELKQDQASYDVLDMAVKKYPDDMELLYSRALAAERIDRLDILERDLKDVLKKQPDHAHALNALGYTLADRTDRYTEALAYITRAFELEPSDPAIIDSMGWVHYRLGDLDKALEFLRRALAKFHDSEIAAHLGEVLWVSGNQEAAAQVWDKALAEYPDSDILINVIRRFNP